MNIPRCEHPNPIFERANWMNLNGEWEFETDKSGSGEDRELYRKEKLSGVINVPFCPESKLSGVGETDFLNSVWYKKEIEIEKLDKRVLLYIGACDYETVLYVNGSRVGSHKGGYTTFSFDITEFLKVGSNSLVINAKDDTRDVKIPSGKQSSRYNSYGCFYTRTTGIWQTVYLEFVPEKRINSLKYYPDVNNTTLLITASVIGEEVLSAKAYYEGKLVGEGSVKASYGSANLMLELSEKHLWELGKGNLYDLELSYGEDKVKSYFGLRTVGMDGYKFVLNGKAVFQRTVLDQGFYPDGIYTAPSDEALLNDVKISMEAGFNGARLHEKIFEPRFLYHCDKMGYMVWEEYANWGLDHSDSTILATYLKEWSEAMERDFNHPSIVGWAPFNETWFYSGGERINALLETVYNYTKKFDPTRPCIDTSGGLHVVTDIYDFHDYEQNPEKFAESCALLENEDIVTDEVSRNPQYKGYLKYQKGQPAFCSEYGGIKWDIEKDIGSWGYGNAPKSEAEFLERYEKLTVALLENSKLMGFCYTQLYDVEQEKNGLYTYTRVPKFDMNILKEINTRKAKNED